MKHSRIIIPPGLIMTRRWGAGLARYRFTWWAAALPVLSILFLVGRGLARPIKFPGDEPLPGPSHQNFRG